MHSEEIIQILAIAASIFAGQGFWTYIQNKSSKKNAELRLLLGLAHDRIIFLCGKYIEQGFITQDEYEDLVHYLQEPYSEFGGNGIAERMFKAVQQLEIVGRPVRATVIVKENTE